MFDLTAYPLFQEALAAVPATERHGPLVTDESGRPVSRRYYWDLYIEMWPMLPRHGGATEAQEAGVALQDVAEHA